ncbi:uncharacterized protein VP01_2652g2 [Puccinia sorghi]|uniref:Uncharacterized protein n=1 Tax=Puccinia sorghi TaxID=27349 RepID=A0A0L6V450_9BASI|nr:uncharacterized protein VP01_2652g2 [Puccinia sorghi]
MGSFQIEQPRYYGVKGFEIIYQTIDHMFMAPTKIHSTTQLAHPLMPEYFLGKVLTQNRIEIDCSRLFHAYIRPTCQANTRR